MINSLLIALLGLEWFGGVPSVGTGAVQRLNPAEACALPDHQGLRTRGFREDAQDLVCRSQRRALSGGGQPRHTIRYRVQGTARAVERLTLELQINSNSGVQRAHRQLSDYAGVLFDVALCKDLPPEIEAAILSGVAGKWSVNGSRVTLQRITVGTPRYELLLSIE
jgi:hypothetical protein